MRIFRLAEVTVLRRRSQIVRKRRGKRPTKRSPNRKVARPMLFLLPLTLIPIQVVHQKLLTARLIESLTLHGRNNASGSFMSTAQMTRKACTAKPANRQTNLVLGAKLHTE